MLAHSAHQSEGLPINQSAILLDSTEGPESFDSSRRRYRGEEKKNELVDPHVALRATCARELERYGANPKVALDWSVCILADIPDLFDSWFTTVSPALAKLAPRSCEQMDKLSPLERARNKPWMVVAHKAKSWSNALHSLAGMSSQPTDLVGHSSC